MKTLITLCSLSSAAVLLLYASPVIPYDKSKCPKLSLPDAYAYATVALGSLTNQVHCTSATLSRYTSADGEWIFEFYSTNQSPTIKNVIVKFDGKCDVRNGLVR